MSTASFDVPILRRQSQRRDVRAAIRAQQRHRRHAEGIKRISRRAWITSRNWQKQTEQTYRYANSMQTAQRRIPVPGGASGQPANYHWTQLLPIYEKELADFQHQVADIKSGKIAPPNDADIKPLPKASITLLDKQAEAYEVKVGAKVYFDREYKIESLAPELNGLTGIRLSHDLLKSGLASPIEFEVPEPVKILIGYFQSTQDIWLQPPTLETDANAGRARRCRAADHQRRDDRAASGGECVRDEVRQRPAQARCARQRQLRDSWCDPQTAQLTKRDARRGAGGN